MSSNSSNEFSSVEDFFDAEDEPQQSKSEADVLSEILPKVDSSRSQYEEAIGGVERSNSDGCSFPSFQYNSEVCS